MVTMDGTVRMGRHDVIVVVIKDDDVVVVVVGLDVEVEATCAVCKSLRGPRGLKLYAVLVGREGEGIFLWETNTDKTKQSAGKARPGQIYGSGLKSPNEKQDSTYKHRQTTHKQHSSMADNYNAVSRQKAFYCAVKIHCVFRPVEGCLMSAIELSS